MRYLKMLGIMIGAVVLWTLGTSSAAAMEGPPGSYRQTCRDIRMRGDDLRARCQDTSGRWRETSLDEADRCWNEIANIDGRLVCEKRGTLPAGSYQETCRDIRRHYDGLRAVCQNR